MATKICPSCEGDECRELYRSREDNIDNLDHSHMLCEACGRQFNVWHEAENKIKEIFGEVYRKYL